MRPPAEIALWLSTEAMLTCVREARDKASYQRRLAIWLTHAERLSARRVAQSLSVSTPPCGGGSSSITARDRRDFIASGAAGSFLQVAVSKARNQATLRHSPGLLALPIQQ
jgi:hypothetical protein